MTTVEYRGKRILDVFLAVSALFYLAPIMVIISLFVAATLGRPILFQQIRPGLLGRPFTLYKFRTMRDAVDSTGKLLPDAVRLTRFGSLLRSTSLDELPELINVVFGEMSIVGPRPLLVEYLDLYTAYQARRHEVKPGLTGWAQVNGRNALDWQRRFDLDVWYVDNQSLWLDLQIICSTVSCVLARQGITQQGEATVTYFEGNHDRRDT